jgi:hypothetical protein
MPRTSTALKDGLRVSDLISMGLLSSKIPRETVLSVLADTGKQSKRIRQLPAHVMVYYVIAMALYMNVAYEEVLRCLVEGFEWLGEPAERLRNTGRSAISQARARLGSEPMERIYRDVVTPIGKPRSKGVWYRKWRKVSIDGMTLDVGDTPANEEHFGRPGASRGSSAFPQVRCVVLAECGTHVLFDLAEGPCTSSEAVLADRLLPGLVPEMLCLADRHFWSYERWKLAANTGAALVWRTKKNILLPCEKRFRDGSFLSTVYPSPKDRRHARHGIRVRVVEYKIDGLDSAESVYRLVTNILDPKSAPAIELAALYHERWEIENAFDELKVHLRGRDVVLRSKTPDLVKQELYGLLLAHFAVRGLMYEAAESANLDSDDLSFVHSLRIVRRKISNGSFPPSGNSGPNRNH